jgi:hypothetical protein
VADRHRERARFLFMVNSMLNDKQVQPSGGWPAALAGAVLGAGLAVWWLTGEVTTRPPTDAVTVQSAPWVAPAQATRSAPRPPAALPHPTATTAATGPAAPAPFQYVGQWMDGGRRAVVISRDGRSVVVPVPGTVDGRYEVISANNRELVLRDLSSSTTQRIALGATSPAGAAGRAAAAAPSEQTVDYGDEPTAPVKVRPDKLPSPSKRISDDLEPEN